MAKLYAARAGPGGAPLLEVAGLTPAQTPVKKGAVVFGGQPPVAFSSGLFLLFFSYPPCTSASMFLKWIYLWFSWERDVEEGGCWLPGVD